MASAAQGAFAAVLVVPCAIASTPTLFLPLIVTITTSQLTTVAHNYTLMLLRPTGVAVSHRITWFQTQPILSLRARSVITAIAGSS